MRRKGRVAAVGGLLAALVACGGTVPVDQLPGSDALSTTLTTLGGEPVRLADLEGQVVLADFWATWCAPCRAQHKILEELYPDYRGEGVEFIAVNVGESAERVSSFVEDRPFSYPLWLDSAEHLAGALRIVGLPSLMVIDADGEIRFLRFGVTGKGALRQQIDAALGNG